MAYLFVFAGVILRLLPHPPNFAPIAAMALFGGTYLNKKHALIIPLLALFIGDIFIGFYNKWIMLSVYGGFFLIGLMGIWLKKHKTLPNIIGVTLGASIIFFLITNFAVWAVPLSMYPHTLQGLLQSYIMGLPFLKNTLLGDIFYMGIMFGLYELVNFYSKKYTLVREGNGIRFKILARKRVQ